MIFHSKELDVIWDACCYFKNEATNEGEIAGLPKTDERYKHLESVITKLSNTK